MKMLDDIEQIKKKAKKAEMRDITQFVALKDFKYDVEKLSEKIFDVIPV